MSIVKPHKLGVIAGPGSEYFTGKVVKHLRRLYIDRYEKLSEALTKRHGMTAEELLKAVTLMDDLDSRKIPTGKLPTSFHCPDLTINVKYTRFANGEEKAEIIDPVRGLNVYIVHDVSNSAPIKVAGLDEPQPMSINDHLMFLFTTINAVKLAGALSVTLVLPTYPYARQHKKAGREALTASLFARFCEELGVERIITLDIHSREIENAFTTCHLENLHGSYQTLIALRKLIDFSDPDIVVVSPDTGAVSRNKFYAQGLHRPLAMLYKERDYSIVSKDAKNSNIKSINLIDITLKLCVSYRFAIIICSILNRTNFGILFSLACSIKGKLNAISRGISNGTIIITNLNFVIRFLSLLIEKKFRSTRYEKLYDIILPSRS